MKKIIKYLLLCLIMLIPLGASAIKTDSINLSESKEGYYCYLLANDNEGANSYDPYYSYRMYAGYSTDKPTPRCFDSEYNNRDMFLDTPNCFFNFYKTISSLEDKEIKNTVYHSYSNWSSKITDSNKYFTTMEDCIAATMITSSTGSGKYHNQILFIEAKSNSEFYSDDEMKSIKDNIYSDFKDDTQFCYAATMYRQDHTYPLAVYYGYPMFIVDYRGVGDKDDSTANALVKDFDSDEKAIINFEGVSITRSPSRRGDAEEGKIVIDGFPHIEDSTITFEELDKIAYDGNQSSVYFMVDSSGNLITDSQTCTGLATESGLDSTVIDSTIEDENREENKDDFDRLLLMGMTKSSAIKACYNGDNSDGQYKCYRYTHLPKTHPMYNTTVWTKKKLGCNFELTSWGFKDCQEGSLDVIYNQCKNADPIIVDGNEVVPPPYCRNITHSGFNGVPDFYDLRSEQEKKEEITCENLQPIHVIYRVITIVAPILTLLFVTFDLISSIISGDPKKVAKFRSKLLRRIIALVLLIVMPILIHILVNTLSKNEYIKDSTHLKCIIIGDGSDIHKKVDKKIETKGNGSTDSQTNNSNSEVKTLALSEPKNPNLITGITINGKNVPEYTPDTKVYNVNVPKGTDYLEIDTTTVADNVKLIPDTNKRTIQNDVETINIVATTDDETFDTITLVVDVKDDDDDDDDDYEVDTSNGQEQNDDNEIEVSPDIVGEIDEEEIKTQELVPVTMSESEIKSKRSSFAKAAKDIKTYTKKHGFKWCAKKGNRCKTKKVQDAISSNNKQKKISCATLVNAALYKAGLYSASDINGHSINSAWQTAKYLRDKKWKLITNKDKLEPGDVLFFYRSDKSALKIPGMKKAQRPGHVEIYAGNGKVYNSGGDSYLKVITSNFNSKSFIFAYRYNGN